MAFCAKSKVTEGHLASLLKEHVHSLAGETYRNNDTTFLCTEYYEFLKGVAAVTPRLNKVPLANATEAVFGIHPRDAQCFATAMHGAFRHATGGKMTNGTRTSKFVLGIRDAAKGVELPVKRGTPVKEEEQSPPPKRCKVERPDVDSPGTSIFKMYNGKSPSAAQRKDWALETKPKVVLEIMETMLGGS